MRKREPLRGGVRRRASVCARSSRRPAGRIPRRHLSVDRVLATAAAEYEAPGPAEGIPLPHPRAPLPSRSSRAASGSGAPYAAQFSGESGTLNVVLSTPCSDSPRHRCRSALWVAHRSAVTVNRYASGSSQSRRRACEIVLLAASWPLAVGESSPARCAVARRPPTTAPHPHLRRRAWQSPHLCPGACHHLHRSATRP